VTGPALLVIALAVMTANGLLSVSEFDVEQRHGQSIADAVALAATIDTMNGSDLASQTAQRNDAVLISWRWVGEADNLRVLVEVRTSSGATFRSTAAGG
jgi:hypothetical protein